MSKWFLILICVLPFPGCRAPNQKKAADTKVLHTLYAVTPGYGGWSVTVFINGQPAIVNWTTTGLIDVSQFVRDGKNHVRMVAECTHERDTLSPCDLTFLKQTGSLRDGTARNEALAALKEDEPDRRRYESELDFEAAMPVEWIWETSDTIRQVTSQDKAEIRQLVEGLARQWANETEGTFYSSFRTRWTESILETPFFLPLDPALMEKAAQKVRSVADFTVEIAPWESVEYFVGTKVVAVHARGVASSAEHQGPTDERAIPVLIRAGSPNDESKLYVSYRDLFFVKCQGRWRMLSQIWRF